MRPERPTPMKTKPLIVLIPVLAALAWGQTVSRAADVPRTIVSVNFGTEAPEKILSADSTATLTSDPREEVGGQKSLKGDSLAATTEWNEFFHSRPGLLPPKEAYKVSFDYKILARTGTAEFYALFRRAGNNQSQDFTNLRSDVGAVGHAELSFAPRSDGDYYLIIGIHHQGAMTVNNIVIQTDPAHRPVLALWPVPTRTWQSPGRTGYFVDSRHGNDAADGRRAAHAWRTLARVNAGTFGPGDTIRLRAGSRWAGFLSPGGSGTPDRPIVLTSYGAGPPPQIDAQGLSLATLYLKNVECWEVSGLDIANKGGVPQPSLTGVSVSEQDFGDARHIVLKNLSVHDVTGSDVKAEGGGAAINCACGGSKVKSRFDGLLIENCHLVRTDRNGIIMGGNWSRDSSWYPSLHVVIRGNRLEDIGGDGIVPLGCDGALVERNVLHGGRMRAQDYAAGIWPWSCDNTVIQYNDVSGMKGTNDGEGYDCDYNCRHTLFQYNFSHDNDGGFMLICDDGSQGMPWNIGNIGSVIRDNVSVNDGLHTFNITGPCRDTQIDNNVFYIGKGQRIDVVASGNWGGAWAADTRFVNNIFYADGQASFDFGGMTGVAFDHNAFWGGFPNRPDDAHAVLADPQLAAPGSERPDAYAPRPASPVLRAGVPVVGEAPHDFGGNPTPARPNIGAFQKP